MPQADGNEIPYNSTAAKRRTDEIIQEAQSLLDDPSEDASDPTRYPGDKLVPIIGVCLIALAVFVGGLLFVRNGEKNSIHTSSINPNSFESTNLEPSGKKPDQKPSFVYVPNVTENDTANLNMYGHPNNDEKLEKGASDLQKPIEEVPVSPPVTYNPEPPMMSYPEFKMKSDEMWENYQISREDFINGYLRGKYRMSYQKFVRMRDGMRDDYIRRKDELLKNYLAQKNIKTSPRQ